MRGSDTVRGRCSATWTWRSGSVRIIRYGGRDIVCREHSGSLRSSTFCTPNGRKFENAAAPDAGALVAGVLFDPIGAATGGADRVRPSVPLVRRPRHRRSGARCDDLHQEPRSASGSRRGGEVSGPCPGVQPCDCGSCRRGLLGGRHAAGGVGQHQEFPPKDGWGGDARQGAGLRCRSATTRACSATEDAGSTQGRGKKAKLCFINHAYAEPNRTWRLARLARAKRLVEELTRVPNRRRGLHPRAVKGILAHARRRRIGASC